MLDHDSRDVDPAITDMYRRPSRPGFARPPAANADDVGDLVNPSKRIQQIMGEAGM